jgi:hypothetical protein
LELGTRSFQNKRQDARIGDQAFQVNPQWPQVVGLRPASKESKPTGKKQILTTIVHVG